ncbi:MAG: RNA-binding protein [Candidatus Aenigmarchaeota archaeon]|nr:RNA-binding protein [Candidatus Aenigmarchaeota archaeon]
MRRSVKLEKNLQCNTCGTNVLSKKNFVQLNCPQCGKTEIIRCSTCKNLGAKYRCKECNFEGP